MQLQRLADKLIQLGLSEKQARVYVANLFLGAAPAQKIAQQAEINRPTTYDILEELAKLGLVSRSVEGARTVFVAADPSALEGMLQRQASEIAHRQEALSGILPQLAQIQHTEAGATPVVRFVRGKEGMEDIRAYAVRKSRPGSTILSMTNTDQTRKLYPEYKRTNPSVRMSKKLANRQIVSDSTGLAKSDPSVLRETKVIGEPIVADMTLYEDMAVFLSYGDETSPWAGILIESKDIVGVLRQLFQIAWEKTPEK